MCSSSYVIVKLVILTCTDNRHDNVTVILIDSFHSAQTSILNVRVVNGVLIVVVINVVPISFSCFYYNTSNKIFIGITNNPIAEEWLLLSLYICSQNVFLRNTDVKTFLAYLFSLIRY